MHINTKLSQLSAHNDGDWMPYCECLLVAAFVKIVSGLANSIFCTYANKTSIEVLSIHCGSNYLCTNLEMGLLALSNESHFSSY